MKKVTCWSWIALFGLLGVMVALMWQPIREESATADEPWILSAGYTYCKGMGFRLHPDEPPLAKMWCALPLLFMHARIPDEVMPLFEGRGGFPLARPWAGPLQPVGRLFPKGRDNWYYWPWYEAERFSQSFLYGGANDADRLLTAARAMQAVLALLTATMIFAWARQLRGELAGVCACALWVFNPVALAHGHIVQTDVGGTLTMLASLWSFTHFIQRPRMSSAVIAGLAFGTALATKLSALLNLPIFVALVALWWLKQSRDERGLLPLAKLVPAFLGCSWLVILLVYAPHWRPAPPLPDRQAAWMGVPWWFETLRPILVPRDFFKAVALFTCSAGRGHAGYLLGRWSLDGWWYYYPVAFALKSPIPFLALSAGGLTVVLWRLRLQSFAQLVPWLGAIVFFALVMFNKSEVGVRHLLPVYGLLSVAIASQLAPLRGRAGIATWALVVWMIAEAVAAHPFFLEYFNEFAGGAANGHKYLLDSNLDWGQDVKRLKRFLDDHGIQHVDLMYFGVPQAIDYYRIPATRVTVEQARQIHNGTLVISAMALMKPEWRWLRDQQQPIARVGYTLFVYRLTK
ncbi:MAG TPA: glycosyltransferase family 39 protein [Verrucomicrobiae bacterium]|nr:glycosyltransferase family 39 protein [Verrucomicrobiae bacterium]